MSKYATIKAIIDQVVTTNGQQEITGALLNEVLKAMVNSLGSDYQYGGIVVPSSNVGTPDQNVFYFALQAGTYTSFGNTQVPNGITVFMWNGSWTSKILFAGDGGVFDITAYNGNTKYADLTAALGPNGANVPESLRMGGMSVKFVSTSNNNYVQYRYMPDDADNNSKFTNIENWQGVENKVVAGSSNLVTAEGIKNAILKNCGIGVLSNFGDLSRKDNFRKSFKSLVLYTNSSSFAKKQIIMSKCQHSSYVGGYIDVTFSVLENNTLTKLCRFHFGTENKNIVVVQGVELSNEITDAFLTIDCSVIYPNSGTTEADTLNTFTISTVSNDTYEKYGVKNISIINVNKDDIDDIKGDISDIQSEIDAMRGEWVDITASGIVTENKYISYLGGISSDNNFSIKTFDVQEGEKYIIDTTNIGSTGRAQYAIYSGEPSSSTKISVGEMVESALHTEVTIPTNAVYLVITYRFGNQYPTSVLRFEEKKENPAYKILLRYNSTTKRIDASRKYSADKDFIVTLKPVSVNNTVQFANFGFANDSNPYPTVLERTTSYNEVTDWIGPIMFHGGSGGDSSRYGFTGGWHGSNGDQTGFATARTDSVKVYADESEVGDGLYKCNSCKIVVTNYIKSCNTIDPAVPDSGTECLQEIVTYHFVDTKIFVTVEIVALVQCAIFRYYGMQISDIFNGDVLMIGDSIFKGSMATSFNVGNTNINDIIVKKDNNTGLYVDAFLDREVNLGLDSRSVTNKAFVSNNKAYYRLIGNDITTIVSQGDSLMWRGSYEFRGAMI